MRLVQSSPWLKPYKEGYLLVIKVKPLAKKNDLFISKEGECIVCLQAPPREGKANEALIPFLSKRLGVTQKQVILMKGQTGRNKQLFLNISLEEMLAIQHPLLQTQLRSTDESC